MIPGVALLAAGLATLLWGEVKGSPVRAPSKLAASTGFLLVAYTAGALDSEYGTWIFVGLCLSWVGDAALLGRSDRSFLIGLGAFLLGHVAYVAAFATTELSFTRGAALFGLAWLGAAAAVFRWLMPHVRGRLRGPVIAYIIVITAMVVLSAPAGLGRSSILIPVGALLFAVSDIAVARDKFVAPGVTNRLWGLPLYYFGQLLLALSVG